MAYNASLNPLTRMAFLAYYQDAAGAGNPGTQLSLWGYGTSDTAATVETSGYFSASASSLAQGDRIDAVMALGATPVTKSYVVTSASKATPVTIALQTTTAG